MHRIALALALSACAATPVSPAAPSDPLADAKAAAAAFDAAQLHGDRAALDHFLADDFVFVRGAGVVADRTAFIAAFTDPAQHLEPFTISNAVALSLAPTCVLIGGETTLRGTDHGTPFAEHIRYADIFQLRAGRWQAVYTQVTMVR